MSSKTDDSAWVPDEALIATHDLARAALVEITPESSIGEPAGWSSPAEGVVSLLFENRLQGYPGWYWTVSVTRVDGAEPTVLEVELLPGDGALLAPEWVPWAVRLAEYHAIQEAAAAEAAAAGDAALDTDDEDAADLDELDDLDAADFDEDGSPILHSGDVDGVDIDELAESDDDEDDIDIDEDEDGEDDLDEDEDEDDDFDLVEVDVELEDDDPGR